jgi:hypothetical protein
MSYIDGFVIGYEVVVPVVGDGCRDLDAWDRPCNVGAMRAPPATRASCEALIQRQEMWGYLRL